MLFFKILLLTICAAAHVPGPDEFARSHGYYAEARSIHTPDGYILTVHRILNPNLNFSAFSPEPFILQHGLLSNSGQWTLLEPKKNLAFILADNGFDVWLTNIRANMYSRRHERLSPQSSEFWDYSWNEHGTIDMPTIIDYVLETTGHKQVWYSGHSMGTTLFFVMGSMRPEYNKKIRHMFALAPVAYMSHLDSGLRHIASQTRLLEVYGRTTTKNHFETDVLEAQFVKYGICEHVSVVCTQTVNMAVGYNPRVNDSVIRRFYDYIPDYASVGQLSHYAQLINHDFTFRMYDYYEMNILKYGSLEPPRYPVEKITAPVTLMYSKNDYFAATVDVEMFSKNLKNVRMYLVPDPMFNHMDFIFSTYADEVVYLPILKIIQDQRIREQREKL